MKRTLFEIIIAWLGILFGFLYGEINGVFLALVALIALDYVTGVIDSIIQKKLSSAVGFRGILKKCMIMLVVAMSYVVDTYVFNLDGILSTAVKFFFIANEGISILENAASIGVPIPKRLIDALEQLKNKSDKGGNDNV